MKISPKTFETLGLALCLGCVRNGDKRCGVYPYMVKLRLQFNNIFYKGGVGFFFEIFIQLEKSYNRESIQALGENHKQLHTTLLNEPESPSIFLSLHINIFGVSFLGL